MRQTPPPGRGGHGAADVPFVDVALDDLLNALQPFGGQADFLGLGHLDRRDRGQRDKREQQQGHNGRCRPTCACSQGACLLRPGAAYVGSLTRIISLPLWSPVNNFLKVASACSKPSTISRRYLILPSAIHLPRASIASG